MPIHFPRMRHLRLVVVPVLLVVSSATSGAAQSVPPAGDEQPAVTVGMEVVVTNRYVWRGFDEGYGPSVQPNAWIERGGWRVSSWSSLALSPKGGPALSEQDITAEYSRQVGAYQVAGGWTGYFFPSGEGQSHEAFLSVARDGKLSPSLSVFQDFKVGSGTYANAAVEYSWPIAMAGVQLASPISIGYNHRQWTDRSGFSDAVVGLRAAWRPSRSRFEITPFVVHSHSLDQDMVPTRTFVGVEVAVR